MNMISFNSLNNAFRLKNMKFNFDHVHYNHTLLSNNLVHLKKNLAITNFILLRIEKDF
jgi:hypothetical protein